MNKVKTKYYEIINNNKITKDIINKCSYAYNKNKKFFGKPCKFFKIKVANNEKDFKKLTGKWYSPWAKGISRKGEYIVIRGPKLFLQNYKKFKGTAKFEMLLAHEINHIYAKHLNIYEGPYWFTEGLAMYVAGQIPGKAYKQKAKYTKEKVKKLMFYRLIMKKVSAEMYNVHYSGINYLITKFGKQKLLKLIKVYSKNMKKRTFEARFKKLFRISYNKFILDSVSQFDY